VSVNDAGQTQQGAFGAGFSEKILFRVAKDTRKNLKLF